MLLYLINSEIMIHIFVHYLILIKILCDLHKNMLNLFLTTYYVRIIYVQFKSLIELNFHVKINYF